MTPKDWASQLARKEAGPQRDRAWVDITATLLRREYARAVRIVKARMKAMEDATPYQWELGYQQACNDLLTALQRGRTR